ncbi:MAG: metalloregulator ArsR/SmtB family transcription factor [Pseudonocardia sp.]|nr:metalloregulator ArsR/SmtB family transcription factor [Pseudonocardia sp.]
MWTALADPHRRAVLERLRSGPCSVGELVGVLGFSQPTTSKHLRVLRAAGMVRVRSEAQRRIYTIDPAPIAELDAWLEPYRWLWNDRLDALGRHLDAHPDTPHDPPSGTPADTAPGAAVDAPKEI